MHTHHEDWTAIIPIRNGSKGLAGKNIKTLAGQALYQHSINHALEAGATRVLISTDIAQVINTAHDERIIVIERPAHLCTDATPMNPVIAHALAASETQGVFVLLQATSPLRQARHIDTALQEYLSGNHDLVFSVVEADSSVLKWGYMQGSSFRPIADIEYCFANRQSLPPVFKPNGAIYIADSQWFLKNRGFETDNIGVITMSLQNSVDVDDQAGFDFCESIILNTRRAAA